MLSHETFEAIRPFKDINPPVQLSSTLHTDSLNITTLDHFLVTKQCLRVNERQKCIRKRWEKYQRTCGKDISLLLNLCVKECMWEREKMLGRVWAGRFILFCMPVLSRMSFRGCTSQDICINSARIWNLKMWPDWRNFSDQWNREILSRLGLNSVLLCALSGMSVEDK